MASSTVPGNSEWTQGRLLTVSCAPYAVGLGSCELYPWVQPLKDTSPRLRTPQTHGAARGTGTFLEMGLHVGVSAGACTVHACPWESLSTSSKTPGFIAAAAGELPLRGTFLMRACATYTFTLVGLQGANLPCLLLECGEGHPFSRVRHEMVPSPTSPVHTEKHSELLHARWHSPCSSASRHLSGFHRQHLRGRGFDFKDTSWMPSPSRVPPQPRGPSSPIPSSGCGW